MRKLFFISSTAIAVMLFPVFAFAASNVQGVIKIGIDIINLFIALLIALALVVFFWGLIKYLASAGGGEQKAEGRQFMLWGIIALFVMVSVWGLVFLLQETFISGSSLNAPPVDRLIPRG